MKLPYTLFVSHGAPSIAIESSPAQEFLSRLGGQVGTPELILCVSAHWSTERLNIGSVERPEIIYDFSGYPDALYRIKYPAQGSAVAAREIAETLRSSHFECDLDPRRGLDHGAWVPLSLMYPQADIPVLQLSVQPHLGVAHHLALGMALAPLRDKGVLIVGSGSATHNLRQMHPSSAAPSHPPVTEFVDWLGATISEGRFEDLVNYRHLGPHAAYNHPTEEHFLPLLVAAGAGGVAAQGRCLHSSYTYGALSMASYAFGQRENLPTHIV